MKEECSNFFKRNFLEISNESVQNSCRNVCMLSADFKIKAKFLS